MGERIVFHAFWVTHRLDAAKLSLQWHVQKEQTCGHVSFVSVKANVDTLPTTETLGLETSLGLVREFDTGKWENGKIWNWTGRQFLVPVCVCTCPDRSVRTSGHPWAYG